MDKNYHKLFGYDYFGNLCCTVCNYRYYTSRTVVSNQLDYTTVTILIAATMLHFVCKHILKGIDFIVIKMKKKKGELNDNTCYRCL